MLINPLSRPLDLVGDKETNYVQDEVHDILETADRIFVPVHGPFYRDSLEILDKVTTKKLVEGDDYKVLHLLKEISTISTKEVFAVIYIIKKEISGVSISYRVPGGKYSELSDLYRELIANYGNYKKVTYWSEILGLPELFPVVPHKHSIMDLVDIGELTTALDLVINAIYSRDFENWLSVYEYLNDKIKEYKSYKETIISNIEERGNALLAKASPFPKEFWFFKEPVDPNVEYPFGVWERRGDYMLYGQMHNEINPLGTFDIPSGYGLQARQIALWQYMKHTTILTHKLTVDKSSVPEGGSVTFTLTTTGGKGGEIYRYALSGAMHQNGEVVLNDLGIGTIKVNVPLDENTNGTRTLTLTLLDKANISKDVEVTDVATAGWYNIGFYKDQYGLSSISTVDEGSTGYIVIKATDVDDGTVLNMIYSGTLPETDLVKDLPKTVTVYDGIAAIEISPRADKLTNGDRYLRVGLSLDNYIVPSVATILYVRDTSRTATMNAYWTNSPTGKDPVLNIQEGALAFLVLETTNIAAGTVANITWSGSATQNDFVTTLPKTMVIEAGGRTAIALTIKADNLTEGLETFEATIKIGTDYTMTASFFIEDVSRNDNIDVRFSSNSIGTNNLSSVKEGTSIYLVIKTEDIPTEGKLSLVWTGTADADDFLTELPTSITIKENYGYYNLIIKPDNLTEGDENITVSVYDQAKVNLIATQSLTIVDSSTAPTYEVSFSSTSDKVTPIVTANEGDVVYGIIQTTQIPDNTVLFLDTLIGDQPATYVNGDVTEDTPTTIVIDDGFGYYPIRLRMDERKDGDKDLVIRLRKDSADGEIVSTNKVVVKDTSVVPTYEMKWSSTYDKLTTIASSNAGQTVYARIQTTSIAPGTALYIEYGQAGIGGQNVATDFLQAHSSDVLPRIVRVDGDGLAIVPIHISKTLVGGTALNLRVSLSRESSNATHVLSGVLPISKATYTPSFASNLSGTTVITSAKEGQIIYATLRTTNVPNNTVFDVHVRIGNEVATVANKDVVVDVATKLTVVNGIGTIPITLAKDNVKEGTEQIDFHVLYDHMSKDEELIYFATATINLLES